MNKAVFSKMRAEMEAFDKSREQIIAHSRKALKLSKAAIYSLHRKEADTAKKQLSDARAEIKKMSKLTKKDAHLSQVGAYGDAIEEFVEASCYLGFIEDKELPAPKKLGVETDSYLMGVCDLVGELVRKAINSAIEGESETVEEIRAFVSDLYAELMLFDFRNTPVRRKFDSIKYGLEKLEDLTVRMKLK